MQKRFGIVAFTFAIFMSCCSCISTPTEDIVVNKQPIKQAITKASDDYVYDAPLNFQSELTTLDNQTQIIVDASVVFSQKSNFAVYALSPQAFSQDQAEAIIYGLFGDTELIKPKTEADYTKDDIMTIILELKSGINSNLYEIDPEAYQESIIPEVEYWESRYHNAPDHYEAEPAIITFQPLGQEEGVVDLSPNSSDTFPSPFEVIDIRANVHKSKLAELIISRHTEHSRVCGIYYRTLNENYESDILGMITEISEDDKAPQISVQEAQNHAESLLSKLGVNHLGLSATGLIPSSLNDRLLIGEYDYHSFEKCYVFVYTPQFDDLITNFTCNMPALSYDGEDQQYAPKWNNEVCKIYVDDNGVIGMDYDSPYFYELSIEAENVQLLPFDEIINRFEQQISIKGAWNEFGGISNRKVYINTVQLGMARISSGTNADEYYYVPVWDFYGYASYDYLSEGSTDTVIAYDRDLNWSMLTVNAIDGSIIDRAKGY